MLEHGQLGAFGVDIGDEPLGVEAGKTIAGKYVLTRRIGFGAMGEVWAARHVSLGGEVAMKLVRSDAIHADGLPSTVRFGLEARLAAQLSRKTRHIVSVTDHGEDGNLAYLVMELLQGESLETRLGRHGPMPVEKVVPLVYQIARALTVAHNGGVIHRDLKPSNVFVTVDEQGKALVKILDFGIAKANESVGHLPTAICAHVETPKHATVAGLLLGTPVYMSPEQACGLPLDACADVWALAVTAYQLLADDLPFDGASVKEILTQVASGRPMPLAYYRPDVPDALHDLFERAFAEDIDARFQSAADFAAAFEKAARPVKSTLVGICPLPMNAISVPPPPTESAHDVPAGVPRRGLGRRSAALGAALLALFALVCAARSHAEREPPVVAMAPFGPVAPPPPAPPSSGASRAEPAATVAPTSVPVLARAPATEPVPRHEIVAVEPAVLSPAATAAPAPTVAPPPAPRRRVVDPGEIF